MSNSVKAVLISFAVHGLVALGLAFWIGHATAIELPLLDLSAVEISFSETPSESEPVTQLEPPDPPTPRPPEPPPDPEPDPPPDPEPDPPPDPEPDPTPDPEPPPEPPDPPTPQPPDNETPEPPDPEPDPTPEPPDHPTTRPLDHQTAEPPSPEPIPAQVTPPAQAPVQAQVDAPPKLQKPIRPDYPKGARQRAEEGDVVLELAINARGFVDSVSVATSCGYPELDAAAAHAARGARFSPAKAGRAAVPSTARITITFRLTGR